MTRQRFLNGKLVDSRELFHTVSVTLLLIMSGVNPRWRQTKVEPFYGAPDPGSYLSRSMESIGRWFPHDRRLLDKRSIEESVWVG